MALTSRLAALSLILPMAWACSNADSEPPTSVMKTVAQAQTLCDASQQAFSFDSSHLQKVDLNGDGLEDYVLSSEAFTCGKASLYGGSGGNTYQIFINDGKGDALPANSILAYKYDIDKSTKLPTLVFQSRCLADGTISGNAKWQWKDGKFDKVSADYQCPK